MLPDPWLDEDAVTAGLRPSPLPDRTQLLDIILSSVPSPSTSGIVVAGDSGSGKTHLLLSIKAGLSDTMDVRTFAGTPELKAIRYGALGAFEADGGDSVLPGLHVLRALTSSLGPAAHLYTPPPGRRRNRKPTPPSRPPLVLLVDDIHDVDPASLAVLLQLIPGFGATLVATADSRRPLPQDLYQLWEEGFLDQYFLPPFTFREAHALCEALLGGQVQRRASSLLSAICGFNAALLCLAIADARSARLLVQREGFWTIDVRAHCDWPRVVERVRTENAARTSEERQALELVALAEPIGLDVVERHFGQGAVEHLLALQHVRMLAGGPPLLRTSPWLRGEATRLSVPRSRSVALRLGIEDPALTRESAPTLLRWMTWTLECGLSLSDELLLAAAPAADRPSTAELAMRAAAAVSDPGHRDEARLLRARALLAEGQLREAAPELRGLAVGGESPAVKSDATHHLMALELLGAVPGVEPDGAEPWSLVAGNVRDTERLLLAGAVPEALQRSSAAMAALDADPALAMFRPAVLLRHAICLRYSLAWDTMDALLDCPAPYALPANLAVCMDVARGYAELVQGLARAARRTLRPVLAELHDAGLPQVLSLAAALLAYAEALCGNPEAALECARQGSSALTGNDPGALLPRLSALYVAAARDCVAGRDGSSCQPAHLIQLAGESRGDRTFLIEAEALSLIALDPHAAAVDDPASQRQLAEAAAVLQGAAGASLAMFAKALMGDEPKSLEAAGRSLSDDRLFAHAAMSYSRAARGYEAKTRSAASRRTTRLVNKLLTAFDSGSVPPLGWAPGRAGS
ncbi:AAA family ATPase [Arthrobacter sp. LFS091]|uniref:AAA family ATPase n=1 Tax=Arthrobacter sp. LFS091 TaxID=3229892 RepID=UPI003A811B09